LSPKGTFFIFISNIKFEMQMKCKFIKNVLSKS
jgi:hypothetical protein